MGAAFDKWWDWAFSVGAAAALLSALVAAHMAFAHMASRAALTARKDYMRDYRRCGSK